MEEMQEEMGGDLLQALINPPSEEQQEAKIRQIRAAKKEKLMLRKKAEERYIQLLDGIQSKSMLLKSDWKHEQLKKD